MKMDFQSYKTLTETVEGYGVNWDGLCPIDRVNLKNAVFNLPVFPPASNLQTELPF